MRVALVHDWLTGMRGGERVLLQLARRYPDADLHTLVHVPGRSADEIDALRVHASPLSRLPFARHYYRALLPLFPWAIERFDLEGYDLVLSTHHSVAKGIRTAPGTPHLCYCFTPMRYVWDQADQYLGSGLRRRVSEPLASSLRRFDRRTAAPDRVTRFVAISTTVQGRIQRHYGRSADVVFPPVDVDLFRPDGAAPDDYYLMVGAFVPYKQEALAIDAFARLGRRLLVVGDGPARRRLERHSPGNVEFLGHVSDVELGGLYARCRALVHPQEEDFGIIAVEAQATGRPVIAFGRGGVTDTVVPLGSPGDAAPTGLFFESQQVDDLIAAVLHFEKNEGVFDALAIRKHAEQFAPERFFRDLEHQIALTLNTPPAA